MTLATRDIFNAVVSHAMSLGQFEQVNAHQPKNPPGNGLSCAVFADRIGGIRSSGLDSTSARLVLTLQVVKPMTAEPADDIDINMIDAVDAMYAAYCGDFTLGGLVRQVDVRGSEGVGLDTVFGYLTVDGIDYRVATVTLPLLINDLWTEVA